MFVLCFCYFWIRKLSSATGIAKKKAPQVTTRTSRKQKRQRISRNVWAQDFLSSEPLIFFGASVFHVPPLFFWFLDSEAFIRYYNCKKQETPQENKKTKGFKGMSGPRTFFRGFVFFYFGGRPHHAENKRILLLTASFCSCFLPPSPENLKSSS